MKTKHLLLRLAIWTFCLPGPRTTWALTGNIPTKQDNAQCVRLEPATGQDVVFCPAGTDNNYSIYLVEENAGIPRTQLMPPISGVNVHNVRGVEGSGRVAAINSALSKLVFYNVTGAKGARQLTISSSASFPASLGTVYLQEVSGDSPTVVVYAPQVGGLNLVGTSSTAVPLKGLVAKAALGSRWLTYGWDQFSNGCGLWSYESTTGVLRASRVLSSWPLAVESSGVWIVDVAAGTLNRLSPTTLAVETSLPVPAGFLPTFVLSLPGGGFLGGVQGADGARLLVRWDNSGRFIYRVSTSVSNLTHVSPGGVCAMGDSGSGTSVVHVETGASIPTLFGPGDPTVDLSFMRSASGGAFALKATYYWDGIVWSKLGAPAVPEWSFPADISPPKNRELFLQNRSFYTLCREMDNLRYFLCQGGPAQMKKARVVVTVTPPAKPWGTDLGANFDCCQEFSGTVIPVEQEMKIWDDGTTWIIGVKSTPALFRPDMNVQINGVTKGAFSYVKVGRKIVDQASWPTVVVVYSSSEFRLSPHASAAVDPAVPPGSTVILGPMSLPSNDAERAYADIATLNLLPSSAGVLFKTTFRTTGSSMNAMLEVKRGKATLTADTSYLVGPANPLIGATSMFFSAESHDANALRFGSEAYTGRGLFEDATIAAAPAGIFPGTATPQWSMYRTLPSDHNSGSPDHAIEVVTDTAPVGAPVLKAPAKNSVVQGFSLPVQVMPAPTAPVWQVSVDGVISSLNTGPEVTTLTLPRPGKFNLMVRTYSPTAPVGWSAWAAMSTVTMTGIGQSTLLAPLGVAGSTRPTFSWTALAGASRYRLRLTLRSTVLSYTVTGSTSCTPPANLAKGTWAWTITPYSADNAAGLVSATGSCIIQ